MKLQIGIDPKKEKQEKKECMTLREVMDWYVVDATTSHQKSLSQVQYLFKKYISTIENERLIDLTTGNLKHLVRPLMERGKKVQSNRVISFISRLYNYAAKHHNYRGENPCQHWTYEKEQPSLVYMTKEIFEKFIEEVKKETDKDIRDLYLLLCYLGNRVSATYKMKFSEINFDQKIWLIPHIKSKNNEDTIISLNSKSIAILQARREFRKSDDVFPQKFTYPQFTWWYRSSFDKICERAGISGYYVHCLRKTVGAYMISELDKTLYEAGKQLGHRQIKSTERSYSALFDKKRQKNSDDLGDALP